MDANELSNSTCDGLLAFRIGRKAALETSAFGQKSNSWRRCRAGAGRALCPRDGRELAGEMKCRDAAVGGRPAGGALDGRFRKGLNGTRGHGRGLGLQEERRRHA